MLPCLFVNDPPTTEIHTLSLHDALPICFAPCRAAVFVFKFAPRISKFLRARSSLRSCVRRCSRAGVHVVVRGDRKSTRLNSSHVEISYAVFCLKKKKKTTTV